MNFDLSRSLDVRWTEIWKLSPLVEGRVGGPVDEFVHSSTTGLEASRLFFFSLTSLSCALSDVVVSLSAMNFTPESDVASS